MKRRRITTTIIDELKARDGAICNDCKDALGTGNPFHVDHVIPWRMGGKDEVSNMQLLCVPCHNNKTHGKTGDTAKIAKAERTALKHCGFKKEKKAKIPSRPFRQENKPNVRQMYGDIE
jgi:5-methylcytosine-specific restriction endonuclease McrA